MAVHTLQYLHTLITACTHLSDLTVCITLQLYRVTEKLKYLGIKGKLHNWIKGYLLNRTQGTLANGTISARLPVVSGVPQGSILGPILFLIYITDIDVGINECVTRLFADDTVIYSSGETIETARTRLNTWTWTWIK